MKVLPVLILLLLHLVLAQRGDKCKTPNEEIGTCTPVRTCPKVYNLVVMQRNNSSVLEYAKKSQCGFDTEPLVCCKDDPLPSQISTTEMANFEINRLSDSSICGIDTSDRIHGGTITRLGEFPWLVALEYKSKLTKENSGIKCGGSIINERYILTAAHCIIHHREFELVNVRLGEWDTTTDPDCYDEMLCADPVQNIKAEKIIPHEHYSKKTKNNDIGLLRLEKNIKYNDYIRPICLPSSSLSLPQNGTVMVVAGWGLTENDTLSTVKLKVNVPVISHGICVDQLRSKYDSRTVTLSQLCVGGEKGKDSCQGDSGGPLMKAYENKITGSTQWYQEGLVSWGIGCGLRDRPGIYTRISEYAEWIASKVSEDEKMRI